VTRGRSRGRRTPPLWILGLATVVLLAGGDPDRSAAVDHIVAAADGSGFRHAASGEPFIPWGLNYDRTDAGLLDELWEDEAAWPTIAADLDEMRTLGANVVRIHLQVATFMDDPRTPSQAALTRLERLVRLAETKGLYLVVTGLGSYRADAVPTWYDALDEDERWATQARFWEAVAGRVGTSPAIFAYDLMNEPVVPDQPVRTWLPGGGFGGYHYVQHITRDPAGRPGRVVTRSWIRRLTDAIRRHDRQHLVTVGFLPFADYARFADDLDFLSVHVYPEDGQVDAALDLLRRLRQAGPVLVEETFPLRIGADGMRDFLVRSRSLASGWLGFYWGDTPADPRRTRPPMG
jgi:hypothetical protein